MPPEEGTENTASLAAVVQRNIRALLETKRASERKQPHGHRVADWITRIVGSLAFVIVHILLIVLWIMGNDANSFRFDPYPYVLLSTVLSIEAIFLSIFVLMSQNRMNQEADRRAELDLQVSLLAEHETTRIVQMTEAIIDHLKIPNRWSDLEELKTDIKPEKVLEAIERQAEEQ